MKVQRKTALVVSGVALVLAAAIGGGIAIGGGDDSAVAAPVSTIGSATVPVSTTGSAAPAATSSAPVTPETTGTAAPVEQVAKAAAAPPVVPVAEPDQGGELRLGMSEAEALATGQLTTRGIDDAVGCHTYSTTTFPKTESAVVISPTDGLVRITQPSSFRTPEGIGAGSTAGDIRNTYAKAIENRLGFTLVPSAESREYTVFLVDGGSEGSPFLDTDRVRRVWSHWSGSGCFLN